MPGAERVTSVFGDELVEYPELPNVSANFAVAIFTVKMATFNNSQR
jgi:hypothetical protein